MSPTAKSVSERAAGREAVAAEAPAAACDPVLANLRTQPAGVCRSCFSDRGFAAGHARAIATVAKRPSGAGDRHDRGVVEATAHREQAGS